MSLDRSLKSANSLIRHRNVLNRAERLIKLAEDEKWNDKKSVFGLPKVGHRKQVVGGKEDAADATAEGAAATPAAGAAKAAAPAAGAKGAAPKAAAPAPGAKGGAPGGAKPAASAPAPKKK